MRCRSLRSLRWYGWQRFSIENRLSFSTERLQFLFEFGREGYLSLNPFDSFGKIVISLCSIAQTLASHRQEEEVMGAPAPAISFDAFLQRFNCIGELSEPIIDHAKSVQFVATSFGQFHCLKRKWQRLFRRA